VSELSQEFVPLTEHELERKGAELAAALTQLDELEEQRKAAAKDFADRKRDLSTEARKLATVIRQKGEYRENQVTLFELMPPRKSRDDA